MSSLPRETRVPVVIDPHIAWLSIMQACDFYGVSRRTIYNWLAAGKLRTQRTPGGAIRIAVDRAQWSAATTEQDQAS